MNNLVLFFIISFISTIDLSALKKTAKKTTKAPFQGVKEFCSFLKPLKFKVSITGNKVIINKTYKDNVSRVNGIIKNGKLYTNDPTEKSFDFAGKYYLLTSSSLRINNLEGGYYMEYTLCS